MVAPSEPASAPAACAAARTLRATIVRQLVRRCGLVAVDYFTEILRWTPEERAAAVVAVVGDGSATVVATSVGVWLRDRRAIGRERADGWQGPPAPEERDAPRNPVPL